MPEREAAKKAPSKKAGAGRKYSPAASASVERELKAMKQGKLRSSSGDLVTNPKQAIAIGLSEARREGDQAPTPPTDGPAGTRTATKKPAAKKAPAKTTATKEAATKKSAAQKTSAKKSSAKK